MYSHKIALGHSQPSVFSSHKFLKASHCHPKKTSACKIEEVAQKPTSRFSVPIEKKDTRNGSLALQQHSSGQRTIFMIFRGPFLSLGFLTKNAVDNAEIGWFWFSAEVLFFFWRLRGGVCQRYRSERLGYLEEDSRGWMFCVWNRIETVKLLPTSC